MWDCIGCDLQKLGERKENLLDSTGMLCLSVRVGNVQSILLEQLGPGIGTYQMAGQKGAVTVTELHSSHHIAVEANIKTVVPDVYYGAPVAVADTCLLVGAQCWRPDQRLLQGQRYESSLGVHFQHLQHNRHSYVESPGPTF